MTETPRKICAFIQTYSDNREILIKFHDADTQLIEFLNSFDRVFFSFHNCSEPYRQRILESHFIKSLRNVKILIYDSIPYPQTFLKSLLAMWASNYEYLVFLQDDVFTFQPGNLQELTHLIKTTTYNFLALEVNHEDLRIGDDRTLAQEGATKLYRASSQDFKAVGMYACDDGAYAGRIEFLVNSVYSQDYFKCATVWDAENCMNDHIMKNPIERFVTNRRWFKRFNIVGGNTWNKENDVRLLNEKFGLALILPG
jgi:hypothetical protein